MIKSMLIKMVLNCIMEMLVKAIEAKVGDKKSKVSKAFAKTFIAEQEQIKAEVLALVNKKAK